MIRRPKKRISIVVSIQIKSSFTITIIITIITTIIIRTEQRYGAMEVLQ